MKEYFVYILKSKGYKTRYVGSADDVEKRLIEHNQGKCRYTKGRRPWELLGTGKLYSRADAMKRERYFKTGQGRKELGEMLK